MITGKVDGLTDLAERPEKPEDPERYASPGRGRGRQPALNAGEKKKSVDLFAYVRKKLYLCAVICAQRCVGYDKMAEMMPLAWKLNMGKCNV